MKPWQINILMLGGVILIAIFFPTEIVKILFGIMVFGSAVWAYFDSKKLSIEKYKKIALTPSTRSYGVFFIVWILWAIAFPMYMSWRYRAINGKIPLKEVS